MSVYRCAHIHVSGRRCAMPAVHNKDLCFEHESRLMRLRSRPLPESTFNPVPVIGFVYPEDHHAILENINSIARAFERNVIDYRQASVYDRLMNTALRTLRQIRLLEKPIPEENMVRDFRLDTDGNPRAIDMPIEPASELAEPAQIPAISAVAEDSENLETTSENELQPSESPDVISRRNLSLLLATLTDEEKINSLLSNTYIFRNGKLIVQPHRTALSRRASAERRPTAWIFLSNMR